jgi:hypothetical protein
MKSCTGTIYNIKGKVWCVGEKLSKKVNGKTVTIKATSKRSRKNGKKSKTQKSH